jgi:surface polysaccharide O-acyltransferase-like enzyme
LSFSEVIVTFGVAGIVQSIFRAKRPPSFVQVCFNASNLALSAWAGLLIVQGLRQQPLTLALILAAALVYLLNTALVSVVLMLVERGSFGAIWKHWCLGSLPYYILGAIIVGAAVSAGMPVSGVAALIVAPSILLSTLYYRFWLSSAKPV